MFGSLAGMKVRGGSQGNVTDILGNMVFPLPLPFDRTFAFLRCYSRPTKVRTMHVQEAKVSSASLPIASVSGVG